jgi:hypothetical protein
MPKPKAHLQPEPEPSKLQEQTTAFTAAWDERKRTFDRLRDLRLTDEARTEAIADYKAALKTFDEQRAKITRA